MPLISALGGRVGRSFEFKVYLVYMVRSRPAGTTWGDPVSEEKKNETIVTYGKLIKNILNVSYGIENLLIKWFLLLCYQMRQ